MNRKKEPAAMLVLLCTTGMSYIWGESPKGHLLSVNLLATPKPDYREVAGRGRDSEIVALRIETR